MRKIAKMKCTEKFAQRSIWGIRDLNNLLFDEDIYSNYWYYTIYNISQNFGDPAIHTLRNINHEEARLFLLQVKAFVESILLSIEKRPQIEILESRYPMFQFITNVKNLQILLKLPENIINVCVEHFFLSAIIENLTLEENFKILIHGESGVGKTSLLFQIGNELLENQNIILAIPYPGINPEDMLRILKEYENVVFLINDIDFYEKQGNFLNLLRNYHLQMKNLIATCKLHEYYNLITK